MSAATAMFGTGAGGYTPGSSLPWGRLAPDSSTASILMYILYVLALGIIICVVLLTVDYFVPFLPGNPIAGPSALARAGKKFWTSNDPTQNLIVPSAEVPLSSPFVWTASFQFILHDSRMPQQQNAHFRHIMHRGSNPFGLTAGIAGPSGHAGLLMSDLPPGADPTYKNNGLPAIMSPGVMLDPYKNDIHIFIHTQGDNRLLLESTTIADVPLEQPMAIGMVCNNKLLEIYVNCQLYDTMLLKGQPYLPSTANNWYGLYGAYPANGAVRNLTLWDGPLTAGDYMKVCSVGGSYGGIALPTCAAPIPT